MLLEQDIKGSMGTLPMLRRDPPVGTGRGIHGLCALTLLNLEPPLLAPSFDGLSV